MKTFGLFAAAGAAFALVTFSAPALAAPNAFWMFGWSARYNHGTGGLADAADAVTLPYAAPATLMIDLPVAVADDTPVAVAPLQLASDDSMPPY